MNTSNSYSKHHEKAYSMSQYDHIQRAEFIYTRERERSRERTHGNTRKTGTRSHGSRHATRNFLPVPTTHSGTLYGDTVAVGVPHASLPGTEPAGTEPG